AGQALERSVIAELDQQLDRLVGLAEVKLTFRLAVGGVRQYGALGVGRHCLHLLQGGLDVLRARLDELLRRRFLRRRQFGLGQLSLAVELRATASVQQAARQPNLDSVGQLSRRLLLALQCSLKQLDRLVVLATVAKQLRQFEASVGVDRQVPESSDQGAVGV